MVKQFLGLAFLMVGCSLTAGFYKISIAKVINNSSDDVIVVDGLNGTGAVIAANQNVTKNFAIPVCQTKSASEKLAIITSKGKALLCDTQKTLSGVPEIEVLRGNELFPVVKKLDLGDHSEWRIGVQSNATLTVDAAGAITFSK